MAQRVYEFDRLTPEQKEEIRAELARSRGNALFVVHPFFSEPFVKELPNRTWDPGDYEGYKRRLENVIKNNDGPVLIMAEAGNGMKKIVQRLAGKVTGTLIVVPTQKAGPLPAIRGRTPRVPYKIIGEKDAARMFTELGIRRATITGETRVARTPETVNGWKEWKHKGCVVGLNILLRTPVQTGVRKTVIRNGVRESVGTVSRIQAKYRKSATFPSYPWVRHARQAIPARASGKR